MFNIGGDDKEKLEENMEEIKNLISNDQEGQQQQNTANENRESPIGDEEGFGGDQEFGEESSEKFSGFENDEASPENFQNSGPAQNSQEDMQGNINPDASRQETSQNINPQEGATGGQENMQPNQRPQGSENGSSQEENSVAEPQDDDVHRRLQNEIKDQINSIEKETRREGTADEENYNQGSEEPLFLEVERFEDIRDMVEEMHYLTTEMDDVMESLAAGIQQDQETAGEANQIVGEFQARRDKIEQILRDN